jgi:glutamate racemase
MTYLYSGNPIGIFDSGIGGLTVAKAISEVLPHENFVYFGDTAHVPWGDKSVAAIRHYSLRITEVLLAHRCKVILIACNTASAAAYDWVKEFVGSRAIVMNVIDPVVQHIVALPEAKRIGLIGTKQTVRLNHYQQKIQALNPSLEVVSLATPLLVPLIEEGFLDKPATHLILNEYLKDPRLNNLDALILGCTHYPLLAPYIQNIMKKTKIIDSSFTAALDLKKILQLQGLMNDNLNAKQQFYVSDDSEFFAKTAKIFFSDNLILNLYPLWEDKVHEPCSFTAITEPSQ